MDKSWIKADRDSLQYENPREAGGKVHGIDIALGHQCVSVDGIIKPDALLPVPIRGELEIVRDSLGSFLAWPEDLISYTTTEIKKKERVRPSGENKNKNDELLKLRAQFLQAKPSAKVPKGFNLLYKHVTNWMETTGLSIEIDCKAEVFGHEKTIYLVHESVLALLEFDMLGQALSRAVKTYNYETGRGNQKPAKAKFLSGSPKQPGGHECAYVVMRYMKEIISDTRLTFATKWLPKARVTYTEAQLEEVRIEALKYIQDKI